jgi:hypothetical protein
VSLFPQIDAANVSNFVRTIAFFRVNEVEGCCWGGRQLYELHLRGSAFLWHQVRCMAAVLIMVGDGQEEPEVVQQYLDIRSEPRKPQYAMASEVSASATSLASPHSELSLASRMSVTVRCATPPGPSHPLRLRIRLSPAPPLRLCQSCQLQRGGCDAGQDATPSWPTVDGTKAHEGAVSRWVGKDSSASA